VAGVEGEVRDAFTNLVLNAVDAMPGGGRLTVRSGQGRGTVWVEFADTGTGMDETTRRRCIEPFYTTKGERGTGLGLAMVYGMAERHGAELHIDSALGEGTRMRLVFPLQPAAPISQPEVADTVERPAPLNLLLIDDDPAVLRTLRSMMRREGHLVSTFEDARQAVTDFAERKASYLSTRLKWARYAAAVVCRSRCPTHSSFCGPRHNA
jgi:hypothetical protein